MCAPKLLFSRCFVYYYLKVMKFKTYLALLGVTNAQENSRDIIQFVNEGASGGPLTNSDEWWGSLSNLR